MYETENMYFNGIYNFGPKLFPTFFIFSGINHKNYDFYGLFMGFTMNIMQIFTIILYL